MSSIEIITATSAVKPRAVETERKVYLAAKFDSFAFTRRFSSSNFLCCRLPDYFLDVIKNCKWNIVRVLGDSFDCRSCEFFRFHKGERELSAQTGDNRGNREMAKLTFYSSSQTRHLDQISNGRKSSSRNDCRCCFDTQVENSDDISGRSVTKRCIGERVVRFFEESVSLHHEEVVVERNALASKSTIRDRFKFVPKFCPTDFR